MIREALYVLAIPFSILLASVLFAILLINAVKEDGGCSAYTYYTEVTKADGSVETTEKKKDVFCKEYFEK